jgi:hypothetical protein
MRLDENSPAKVPEERILEQGPERGKSADIHPPEITLYL